MNEHDGNTPALMGSLSDLDVALEEFQQLISQADLQSLERLERLKADEGDLIRLGMLARERLTQIDVFHTLGLDEKEEFHSNYLAWLLSHRESRSWLLFPAGVPEISRVAWRHCCPGNRWDYSFPGV